MATVFIPASLRQFTAGASQVAASGETLREVIEDVERQHPEFRGRVLEDGALRPEVFLAVGSTEAFGLDIRVEAASEVFIIPAIAGGCGEGGQ